MEHSMSPSLVQYVTTAVFNELSTLYALKQLTPLPAAVSHLHPLTSEEAHALHYKYCKVHFQEGQATS